MQRVVTATRFKLKHTCPSEYYEILFYYLPKFAKMAPALDLVMELAMTEAMICGFNSEEILLAVVVAIIEYKDVRLSPLQETILRSLGNNWDKILLLSQQILAKLQSQ